MQFHREARRQRSHQQRQLWLKKQRHRRGRAASVLFPKTADIVAEQRLIPSSQSIDPRAQRCGPPYPAVQPRAERVEARLEPAATLRQAQGEGMIALALRHYHWSGLSLTGIM